VARSVQSRFTRSFATIPLPRLDFPASPNDTAPIASQRAATRVRLPDGTTSRVSLKLASVLASVDQVEETALEYAASAGFDADTASNLAMVTREAAVNAIIHGNRYNPALQVTATFEISSEALTIRIADAGPGLDPAGIPDPLAPENLLRSSGRGVFLMRAFMDEVHFRQSQPGAKNPGTEVILVKHRKRPA